jgi:hypothetical protein
MVHGRKDRSGYRTRSGLTFNFEKRYNSLIVVD